MEPLSRYAESQGERGQMTIKMAIREEPGAHARDQAVQWVDDVRSIDGARAADWPLLAMARESSAGAVLAFDRDIRRRGLPVVES